MNRFLPFLLGFFCMTAGAVDTPPDVLIKNTANEVLTIIKQDKDIQAGNQAKVHSLIDAKVLPHFDFNRMTRLAVGKSWNNASATQKDALVKEFRNLLVRTYASSLASYRDQVIEYKPLRYDGTQSEVTVNTQIKQPGAQPIPIDYAMAKTDGAWKVYDIVVDGVSLVTNYRSSFAAEIKKSGIDGLIQTLSAKNQQESGPSKK